MTPGIFKFKGIPNFGSSGSIIIDGNHIVGVASGLTTEAGMGDAVAVQPAVSFLFSEAVRNGHSVESVRDLVFEK